MHKAFSVLPAVVSLILFSSCHSGSGSKKEQEKAKQEIAVAEKDFEKMAKEKGIAEAFSYFADSTVVMKAGEDSLVRGKEGVRSLFNADRFKTATVTWSADFVDASSSGDLGYTYGRYTWLSKDSSGKINETTGIFHTVWKKQKDGSWRFVWD